MKTSLYTTDTSGNKIYIAILDDYSSVTFNYSPLIANKQPSPLYTTTFDLMTDAQIKAQMDLWVNNGTLPNANLLATSFDKRIRSVGKNLFDKSNVITNYYINVNGVVNPIAGFFVSDYIEVKPNTAYVQSSPSDTAFYDVNKNFISYTAQATYTTPINTKYIRLDNQLSNLLTFQLELGSTATTYEPYVNNDLYLQGNALGYRLPNGVKDTIEFRNGKYYKVQRVKKYMLVSGDIINLETSPTNIDYVGITKPLDSVNYNTDSNDGYYFVGYTSKGYVDSLDNINKVAGNASFTAYLLCVAKGTYTDLLAAQTALAGTDIYYQLATPIETEILASGNIQGQQNGTVYVENATQDADIYATSATVSNSALPISSLSEIIKIGADGLQTRLAVSTAVIAGDGLSFTHSGLTAGDIVWFSYYHEGDYFSSTTTITYYDNNNVLISPDGSAWKETRTIDNSGVITSLWVKV